MSAKLMRAARSIIRGTATPQWLSTVALICARDVARMDRESAPVPGRRMAACSCGRRVIGLGGRKWRTHRYGMEVIG